jgi:hypothetical protein
MLLAVTQSARWWQPSGCRHTAISSGFPESLLPKLVPVVVFVPQENSGDRWQEAPDGGTVVTHGVPDRESCSSAMQPVKTRALIVSSVGDATGNEVVARLLCCTPIRMRLRNECGVATIELW